MYFNFFDGLLEIKKLKKKDIFRIYTCNELLLQEPSCQSQNYTTKHFFLFSIFFNNDNN